MAFQNGTSQGFQKSICPGCGLAMPVQVGASYDGYYFTSPECWSVYTEVLGAEFSNAILFGQVHQLTVDTYAVQHAGGPHPDKSIDVHLCGLYLVLERNLAPPAVPPYLQDLAGRVDHWPHYAPPDRRSEMTVLDVALAGSMMEHAEKSRVWAQSVWDIWADYHDSVAGFLQQHLAID